MPDVGAGSAGECFEVSDYLVDGRDVTEVDVVVFQEIGEGAIAEYLVDDLSLIHI